MCTYFKENNEPPCYTHDCNGSDSQFVIDDFVTVEYTCPECGAIWTEKHHPDDEWFKLATKQTLCPTCSRHHIRNLNVAYWVKLTGMMPPEYCGHYECSRCNWRHKHTIENKFKYCPGCGSKMINAQEDS